MGQRFAVVLEIVPCLIDVVAGAALQVAVLGHVVLELQTGDETVLADRIADFVRHDVRADLAQVAVREGVETERGVYGAVALVFFQNVYGREELAVVAARLVLMRVGVAQRVGQTAFEEARIQLGGYRRDIYGNEINGNPILINVLIAFSTIFPLNDFSFILSPSSIHSFHK